MNKKEIVQAGYDRGLSIGQAIDLIDIGDYVDKHIVGESENLKVTTSNWLEVHTPIAYECESNDRQFSPFELLAHDINEYENSHESHGEAWNWFDEAITRGITKALKQRFKSVVYTKDDYGKHFDGTVELFNACWRILNGYAKSSINLDFNDSSEVEEWLDRICSELVNDCNSKFYIHG